MYAKHTKAGRRNEPQSIHVQTDARQIKNDSGAYQYPVEDANALRRFLILGTTVPTYTAGSKNVKRNAELVERLVKQDGIAVVNTILDVDNQNLSPSRDTLLFVLALALKTGNLATRRYAAEAAKTVVRTGRDISTFTKEMNALGGWGRLSKKVVAEWYGREGLAYQVAKYRPGDMSHRDMLRLCHAKPDTKERANLFAYLTDNKYDVTSLPAQLRVLESLKNADTVDEVVQAIRSVSLTHEMIPTQFKDNPLVWEALVPTMPYRALVWNLGTMSELGLLKPLSPFEKLVVAKLRDENAIIGSRIHPFTLLVALRNYAKGSGIRKSWPVNKNVVTALEFALNTMFDNVTKIDKSVALIVDVSGSMSYGYAISPIEAAAAMTTVQCRQAVNNYVVGVDTNIHSNLNITETTSFGEVTRMFSHWRGGGTNLGLALEHLINNKIEADVVIFYTDNENNRGVSVTTLFDKYRRLVNPNAKLIVVAFEANETNIADTTRPYIYEVCGIDNNTASIIAAITEGKV